VKIIVTRLSAAWSRNLRLRFVAVGVYNTVFGYACFASLFLAVGRYLHYIVLQVIAHFVSVASAFVWHRRVTFRSSAAWPAEFLRFNASYLGTLAFGVVALPALVDGLGWHPLVAAAVVTVATVVLSYALHTNYSFRRDR
jgi:putative flippase GtrA